MTRACGACGEKQHGSLSGESCNAEAYARACGACGEKQHGSLSGESCNAEAYDTSYAGWGGALMPCIQLQQSRSPHRSVDGAPVDEVASSAADRAKELRAQIRRRAARGGRGHVATPPARSSPQSTPRGARPRTCSSSGVTASVSVSSACEMSKSDMRAKLLSSASWPLTGRSYRRKTVSNLGLLDTTAVFLPMPLTLTPTPPGTPSTRISSSPSAMSSAIGWQTKSAKALPVGPAIERLPKDYAWVSTSNAYRQRARLTSSTPRDFTQKFGASSAACAAAGAKQAADVRPLRKGDVVYAVEGDRKGEEGIVQAVWRSNADKTTDKVRAEVVVRYPEGGSWFKDEDLERIGTGRALPPLWAAFEQQDERFRIKIHNSVKRLKATAEKNGQVTINGLIEGEISVERRAMIEATQMRKRTKLDPFSMKGFDELRLFRAVMDDDVDRLQDLIIKIASASPTDISSFRNGRGESLLEMARDRRKSNCAQFMEEIFGIMDATRGSVQMNSIFGGRRKVQVHTEDVTISLEDVLDSQPFKDWVQAIDNDPIMFIHNIEVQSVDMFGPRVGFVKFRSFAQLSLGGDEGIVDKPGIVFMRGGTVAVLMVLECEGKEYTILTYQARVPVGMSMMPEVPAGMLDGSGNFRGLAAEEIEEECDIVISEDELTDMTELAYGDKFVGMFPSAGGCDEFIRLYTCRRVVEAEVINELQGRLTGLRSEGERITLSIVPLDTAWKVSPDGKLLSCLILYSRLQREGKFQVTSTSVVSVFELAKSRQLDCESSISPIVEDDEDDEEGSARGLCLAGASSGSWDNTSMRSSSDGLSDGHHSRASMETDFGRRVGGRLGSTTDKGGRARLKTMSSATKPLSSTYAEKKLQMKRLQARINHLEAENRGLKAEEMCASGITLIRHHASITLSCDGKLATKNTAAGNFCTAACGQAMTSGRHYTVFTVVEGVSMFFGVIRKDWDVKEGEEAEEHTENCFYSTYSGSKYPGFSGWEGRMPSKETGSQIGMLLEVEKGTMSIYKNDMYLGVMATELECKKGGGLCWAVLLEGRGDIARIEPSLPPPEPGEVLFAEMQAARERRTPQTAPKQQITGTELREV